MGINEVTNQTAVRGYENQYNEEPKKVVQPKIEVGAALLDKSGEKVGAGTVGLGAEVNLGKGWTVEPQLNGYAGSGVIGGGAEIGIGKQLNPHWQINAGVGVDKTSFAHKTTVESTDFAIGTADNNDEDGIKEMNKGEYVAYGTTDVTTGTKSEQTTVFGKIGAKYSPNKKLSFTGNLELGAKSLNGDYQTTTTLGSGLYCTEGAKYEPQYIDPGDPEMGVYTYRTQDAKVQEFTIDETNTTGGKKTHFTGRVGVGAEYKLNKHISAGVNAQIGLNNNSDNFVGGKIAYRF